MKKILISTMMILIVCWVSAAMASGTYSTDIDNVPVKIVFTQGPFGPGESGTAALFVDGKLSGEYSYVGYDYGGTDVFIYDVHGLCWFMAHHNIIDAFQPLGISLTRQADKSIYQIK